MLKKSVNNYLVHKSKSPLTRRLRTEKKPITKGGHPGLEAQGVYADALGN